MPYFSEREYGSRARIIEEVTPAAWHGIVAAIRTRIEDGSFGLSFPVTCPDGNDIYAASTTQIGSAMRGQSLPWPLDTDEVPGALDVLDLVEFCHEKVAQAIREDYHAYFKHYHIGFNKEEGQRLFRVEVNRILSRNGIAYELKEDGEIQRLGPPILRESLVGAVFATSDDILDKMLESARQKFLDPDLTVRAESLEKLWDVWERLKTLEGTDKKTSIGILLEKASPEPNFRELLKSEAIALTGIGNSFLIRHSEVGKIPVVSSEHVDYLFHRMFSLIRLLLRETGRSTDSTPGPISEAGVRESEDVNWF